MTSANETAILTAREAMLTGDIDSARVQFESVLGQDPDNPEALVGIAEMHFLDGEQDRGEAVLTEALERNPQSASILCTVAQYRESMDDYEAAQDLYEQARTIAGDSPQIAAGLERMNYYLSGEAGTLIDGTFIGEHTGTKRRLISLAGLGNGGGLLRAMAQFYEHIDVSFNPTIWHRLTFVRPKIGVGVALLGLLFILTAQDTGAIILGAMILLCGTAISYAGFRSRSCVRVFMDDVRQHFIDETGYQIADPDRGNEELRKIVNKSNLGFMFLLYASTGWMYASREERYEVVERLDLPEVSWWDFKNRAKFAKRRNLRRLIEEALNRHWLFHLRNPKTRPAWDGEQWSDDHSYVRHLLRGENADGFNFKPPRPSFLGRVLRLFWLPFGLTAAMLVGTVGIIMVISLVLAPQGQLLLEVYVPAVLYLRKPAYSRNILSIPVKDGLVVRNDLVSPMLLG